MSKRSSKRVKLFALSASSVLLAQMALADVITLNVSDGFGASSFATGPSWSNATAPSAIHDYHVRDGRSLRTVADSGSATFAGGSLTLGNGTTAGIFIFKNQVSGAVVTVDNLTLNNGEIQTGGTSSGAAHTVTLAGNGITLAAATSNRLNSGGSGRNLIVSAPISGSGNLVVQSGGGVFLTGANTYTGSTTINSGSFLNIGNTGTSGSLSTSSAIANSGTLIFRRTDTITQGTDFGTISGTGAVQNLAAGTVILNSANAYSGLTTIGGNGGASAIRAEHGQALGSNSVFIAGNGGTNRLELAGGVSVANQLEINGKANDLTAEAAIVNVSGNNTLSGTVRVQTGGSHNTFRSDAGLLTFSGTVTSNATGSRNILLTGDGNIDVTGAITNGTATMSIFKQGAGNLAISGTSTYTGTTTVTAGALFVNGSLGNTAVTVDEGGTLGGSGTIAGAVTVNGTLAAGNSPGVLTISNNLTLGDTSTSIFEVAGLTRGTEYDGVDVGGALTYAGALSISFTSTIQAGTYSFFEGFTSQSGAFDEVSFGGAFAESISGSVNFGGAGWTASSAGWTYDFDYASGDMIVSAIPEPSSAAALAGMLMLGFAGLRRRRSIKA